jgi:DNA-binding response OmpR family regulator
MPKVESVMPNTIDTELHTPSLRVLVVDDDESMVDVVCRMLENLDIAAIPASGSIVARRHLEQGRYDLLVTDLEMPDMNGYELAGWAKSRLTIGKVVIMTACDDVEEYRALAPSPVDYWLFKPFNFSEFTTVIKCMLEPGAGN